MPGSVDVAVLAREGEGLAGLLLGRPAGQRHPGRAHRHAPRRHAPLLVPQAGGQPPARRVARPRVRHQRRRAGRDADHARGPDDDLRVPVLDGLGQRPARVLRRAVLDAVPDVAHRRRRGTTRPSGARSRPRGRAGCSGPCCGRATRSCESGIVAGERGRRPPEPRARGARAGISTPTGATPTTAWERKLQRVRIETPDKARKTVFYTALYHAMLAPTACTTRTPATAARTARRTAGAVPEPHRVLAVGHVPRAASAADDRAARARGRPRAVDDGRSTARAASCPSGRSGATRPTR